MFLKTIEEKHEDNSEETSTGNNENCEYDIGETIVETSQENDEEHRGQKRKQKHGHS